MATCLQHVVCNSTRASRFTSCRRLRIHTPVPTRTHTRTHTTVRYLLHTCYDGTAFHGAARQAGEVCTVQGTVESALQRLFPSQDAPDTGNSASRMLPFTHGHTILASRTDAGVHAIQNALHVDFHYEQARSVLPPERLQAAINSQLPRNGALAITRVEVVAEDVHARFSVTGKTYTYDVAYPVRQGAAAAVVPLLPRAWVLPAAVDIDTMARAAELLVGEHDFSAFRAAGCAAASPVKQIFNIDVRADVQSMSPVSPQELRDRFGCECVRISIRGRSFLYKMVRNIVGTLVIAGQGRWSPAHVGEILRSRDRRAAGRTAPSHALTLQSLEYHVPKQRPGVDSAAQLATANDGYR